MEECGSRIRVNVKYSQQEKRLEEAILAQAIDDLITGRGRVSKDAKEWIFEEADVNHKEKPFSFINICHDIGSNPQKIRADIELFLALGVSASAF